ncbi:MAG: pyridoxine 5'-phosphate synthase [Pirellulaceae bacterium]
MPELGVNIDHVATIRQARKTYEPDPVAAAVLAELAGADSITIHLREDRRHIQDRDLRVLRETVTTKLNLELSVSEEIVGIACQAKPEQATLVPERREEVTTEGGLDVSSHMVTIARAVKRLQAAGIVVSLFIDPDPRQLQLSKELGVEAIELHTGQYALAKGPSQQQELAALVAAGKIANDLGLRLHAGHGLNYHNVRAVATIEGMLELNIGHSIISRAVLVGLERAVREMKSLL